MPSVGPATTVGSDGSLAPGAQTPGVTWTAPSFGLTLLVSVMSRVLVPSTVTWALLASGTPSVTPVPENVGSPKSTPVTAGTCSVRVTTVPFGMLYRDAREPSAFTSRVPVLACPPS